MSVDGGRLVCRSVHQISLGASRAFAALARVVVAREREHVGQVLAKLSRSRQASLRHTCHSRAIGLVLVRVSSGVASINDVVLTVIKALCSILGQHRRVRGWSS